jgi:hypothetical protein
VNFKRIIFYSYIVFVKSAMSLFFILALGCGQPERLTELEAENELLRTKVDILTNELNKFDMMIEAYEGMPLGI